MNFRNYVELDNCVRNNLSKLPRDVDLVVGIPRSGLMVASIVALYLNVPLADMDGVLEDRILAAGRRMKGLQSELLVSRAKKILVLDDSCCSGYEMERCKQIFSAAGLIDRCIFAAIYVAPGATAMVDLYFEICPMPRMFSWNFMHHVGLENACVDIDGVLCVDPLPEQNDDGERYLYFLQNAKPLFIPTVKIGALVTCRLERYRRHTVEWLNRHNVQFNELVMWDLPNKNARIKHGGHGIFKGAAYKERQWADVFLESSLFQANVISNHSCKPVICVETQNVINPTLNHLLVCAANKTPRAFTSHIHKFLGRIKDYLQLKVRY